MLVRHGRRIHNSKRLNILHQDDDGMQKPAGGRVRRCRAALPRRRGAATGRRQRALADVVRRSKSSAASVLPWLARRTPVIVDDDGRHVGSSRSIGTTRVGRRRPLRDHVPERHGIVQARTRRPASGAGPRGARRTADRCRGRARATGRRTRSSTRPAASASPVRVAAAARARGRCTSTGLSSTGCVAPRQLVGRRAPIFLAENGGGCLQIACR